MQVSEQAEQIFSGFGRRFNLVFRRETYGDGDVCYVFDVRSGLKEKVWMCFGNVDEISFGVGEFFSGSAFPCPDAFDGFTREMNGILSGQYRIRYGWFRSVLEEKVGERWRIRARYSGPEWSGFRFRVFDNTR